MRRTCSIYGLPRSAYLRLRILDNRTNYCCWEVCVLLASASCELRVLRTWIYYCSPYMKWLSCPHMWSTPHTNLLLYRINYCPIPHTNQVFSTIWNLKSYKNNSFIFDGAWMWQKYIQGFGRESCTKEEDRLENLNIDGTITLVEMLKK